MVFQSNNSRQSQSGPAQSWVILAASRVVAAWPERLIDMYCLHLLY